MTVSTKITAFQLAFPNDTPSTRPQFGNLACVYDHPSCILPSSI